MTNTTPLAWNKVRAGAYEAADRDGHQFLIRQERHHPVYGNDWIVFVDSQRKSYNRTLAGAKRYVEAIARVELATLGARYLSQ